MKVRLTKDQKRALNKYNECLRQEDRLGMSVFANAFTMQKQEEKTQIAYQECKRLGMTHEHGM